MNFLRRLVGIVLLAAGAASGASTPPNIVLITLDTVRADRMGFLGSTRKLTPNLDVFARQSVVFSRAYAQAPITTASHATILTGTYPQFHQVTDFGVPLAPDLPYAPQILSAHGYHTAAFIGSLILDPASRSAPGFERGFDLYDSNFHRRRPGEDRYQSIERRGEQVIAHALDWLDQQPRAPFFIWIHLYDAHDPYDPPEPFKTRYAATPYDGEIAYVDSVVGKLLAQLLMRGLYRDAMIAVMSDHGESLGDHGELTHGIFLYDSTIRVPLIVKLPGGLGAGERIQTRARLADVLPTILDTVHVPVPKEIQGESLMPLIQAAHASKPAASKGSASKISAPADRSAYSESDYPHRTFGWSSLHSLRTGKYLFVQAPRPELYDQLTDPKAEHNLASFSSAVATTLETQTSAFRQRTATSKDAPVVTADPELQEKLNALGYVGDNTNAPMPGIKDTEADPKDKIEIVNLMHRAEMMEEGARYQEAVPLLEQVIAKEPGLPIAYLQLGTSYTFLKNYAKSIPVLRKAVEMRPDLTIPRFQLGSALFETGDMQGAIEQFEICVSRSPRWPEALYALATAYARTDRLADAIKDYRKVVELRPNHYGANLLLGRALTLSGTAQEALAPLTKASELQPQSAEPHSFLADAYTQLGRETDAQKERSEAERLRAGTSR